MRRRPNRLWIFWIFCLALAPLVACGGGDGGGSDSLASLASAELAEGEKLYRANCAMCHGYRGEGVQGLGKAIVGSDYVRSTSDEELVQFLIEGRAANHPDNTQGIAMPPRGGNPRLTDADLARIVAYMRSIN